MIDVYAVRITFPDNTTAECAAGSAYACMTFSWAGEGSELYFSGDARHVMDWAAENELGYEEFRFRVDLDARTTGDWRVAT